MLACDPCVQIRPLTPQDSAVVLAIRNDPTSVAMSTSQRPVTPAEHAAWFEKVVSQPEAHRFLVAERYGVPVGVIRADIEDATATVSLGVLPTARRQGVATRLLRELLRQLSRDYTAAAAIIRDDNSASRALFRRHGFIRVRIESSASARYERPLAGWREHVDCQDA